jgi:hypothetical protein
MMDGTNDALNAHEAPPARLKETFKKYQRLKPLDIGVDSEILDFSSNHLPQDVEILETISVSNLKATFFRFMQGRDEGSSSTEIPLVYSHKALPGRECSALTVFPCVCSL